MRVYLVGVCREIQYWRSSPGPESAEALLEFEDYLHQACACLQIDLIAEEFSEYVLRISNSSQSSARNVAEHRGIAHLFCDPSREERTSLRIAKGDHGHRMRIWLQRILNAGLGRVLFLCGDHHTEDFARLLSDAGHQVETLSRGWGKNWERIN